MKNILRAVFEPFYYLYQRKISDKIIFFLKKYPIWQYVIALFISLGILYFIAMM
jgi:hypothetical protein